MERPTARRFICCPICGCLANSMCAFWECKQRTYTEIRSQTEYGLNYFWPEKQEPGCCKGSVPKEEEQQLTFQELRRYLALLIYTIYKTKKKKGMMMIIIIIIIIIKEKKKEEKVFFFWVICEASAWWRNEILSNFFSIFLSFISMIVGEFLYFGLFFFYCWSIFFFLDFVPWQKSVRRDWNHSIDWHDGGCSREKKLRLLFLFKTKSLFFSFFFFSFYRCIATQYIKNQRKCSVAL